MAFLGDFGKFFGLGSSKQVLGDVGETLGGFVGLPGAGKRTGEFIGEATSSLGTADQPFEQSALPTPRPDRPGASETSRTGSQTVNIIDTQRGNGMTTQGNIGNLIGLLTKAGRALGGPVGGIATGVGTTALLGMGNGSQGKPVLTQSRRNKARVRQMVNFLGIEGTAEFLTQQGGITVTPNDVVALLLRTFRNDGAYITKAQVRNLRRTTNRFKSLEKQVKEATSMTKTTRRASPMRRAASTTLIKN